MRERFAGLAALIVGLALTAHAALAFTKNRWVTGSIELVGAVVLLWHWWLQRRTATEPRANAPGP